VVPASVVRLRQQALHRALQPAQPWPQLAPATADAAADAATDAAAADATAADAAAAVVTAGNRVAPAAAAIAAGAPGILAPPRLLLWHEAGVIMVAAADVMLAAQLARLGLDRLVLPLALPALEDLLAYAG
jgi:hypothetical protein